VTESSNPAGKTTTASKKSWLNRALDWIEIVGNKLPDPAVLFLILMIFTWVLSAFLAPIQFTEISPRDGEPIRVINQLTGSAIAQFMSDMVSTFTGFHPLGVVLVALLGVGVAEHTGFVNAGLKWMLGFTPKSLLTPMLILVAIVSHTAADAGYVLVIPLGGVIFYAAGRHPLAGIAAAFAGVSGGFAANFIPSGMDPLLQGLTQAAGQLIEPDLQVNPLCNWLFTSLSSILVITVGWYITDRVVEPRVNAGEEIDGDPEDMPQMEELSDADRKGLFAGLGAMTLSALVLFLVVLPGDSAWRSPEGDITAFSAPLMQSIVPLIFLFFIIPGIVHGYVAGSVKSHRDVVAGMSKAMSTMGYYLVMAFFASLFIYNFLRDLGMPGQVTIVGIIVLSALVNLLVGSASAKWALLAPIFVPMLMQLGLSPELTQAAYRVGDSTTNIITPLMPYFPLVVVFCKRYVKSTGIGTVVSIMLPYSVSLIVTWTVFLVLYWMLGIPLGLQASFLYP
jgi:aminobenzoyl-glutamate transport protein